MWGICVDVPRKLHDSIFHEPQCEHQDIARMKPNGCSYVWWSSLDQSLEKIARDCAFCKMTKSTPAVAPLHPWVWPS